MMSDVPIWLFHTASALRNGLEIKLLPMKMIRPVLYFFAFIGFAYLATVLLFSFGPRSCERNVIRMVVSPGQQYEANVSVSKCNDKGDATLELNLADKAAPEKLYGVVLGAATTTDVDLTWLSADRLRVTYPPSFQLSQEPSELHGIKITFARKLPG